MAEIWKGAPVAAALSERTAADVAALKERGIVPTLAILRVGARDDDLSYERGAMKRCEKVGVAVKNVVLPEDVDSDTFFRTLEALNGDAAVHGILMFRPLPKQLDGEKARRMLSPAKDVDGCTDGSLAGVFTNTALGFPPCTAQAAMEILKYYGVDPKGKRAVVIGRSLVIGRPVAMMLVPSITREADILVAASGQMESVGEAFVRPGQILVDVGIGWNEAKQKLCGDVRFEEAEPVVAALTPVPGGVGSVTTAVLCSHVVEAARRAAARES